MEDAARCAEAKGLGRVTSLPDMVLDGGGGLYIVRYIVSVS